MFIACQAKTICTHIVTHTYMWVIAYIYVCVCCLYVICIYVCVASKWKVKVDQNNIYWQVASFQSDKFLNQNNKPAAPAPKRGFHPLRGGFHQLNEFSTFFRNVFYICYLLNEGSIRISFNIFIVFNSFLFLLPLHSFLPPLSQTTASPPPTFLTACYGGSCDSCPSTDLQ